MFFTKWLNSHFAGLPQVTNLCALTHNGTILVSWNAAGLPVSGYMIDYTHNGTQYYWKETQYTNVTLFGKPVDALYIEGWIICTSRIIHVLWDDLIDCKSIWVLIPFVGVESNKSTTGKRF